MWKRFFPSLCVICQVKTPMAVRWPIIKALIGLIPVLTKAIQEQQKTIADVKQENEAIKAENQELKSRLDKIEQMVAANSGKQSSASAAVIPGAARLQQNAPNPFNQNTVIKY